jgi:hypothetical protein
VNGRAEVQEIGGVFRTGCPLWAIDAVEADTLRVLLLEDFDGVAVEDGDDWAGGASCSEINMRARFVIETDAVSLSAISFFTVVSVG